MADIFNQFRDFKSFEVIFRSEEKGLQKIFCTVKSIENTTIILNANNQKNKNVSAPTGTDLQLNIYTDSGIYSATSKVVQVTPGLVSTEYVITYPANSKHSQRREFFRADIPVEFQANVTVGRVENVSVIKGKARNICGKGISYVSKVPFIENDRIEFEIFFEDKTVTTAAELVYTKVIEVNGVEKFVHAFVFTDISKKNIDFIIQKCFLHQLSLKKRPV